MSERNGPDTRSEEVKPYAFTALYGSALAFVVGVVLGEGRIVFLAVVVALVTVVAASRESAFEAVRVCLSFMVGSLVSLLAGTDTVLDLAGDFLRLAILVFAAYCLYDSCFR
jgi:hypothetical protein